MDARYCWRHLPLKRSASLTPGVFCLASQAHNQVTDININININGTMQANPYSAKINSNIAGKNTGEKGEACAHILLHCTTLIVGSFQEYLLKSHILLTWRFAQSGEHNQKFKWLLTETRVECRRSCREFSTRGASFLTKG